MGTPLIYDWVCGPCAAAHDGVVPQGHIPMFHDGTCDWCEKPASVAGPLDFSPRPRTPFDKAPRKPVGKT